MEKDDSIMRYYLDFYCKKDLNVEYILNKYRKTIESHIKKNKNISIECSEILDDKTKFDKYVTETLNLIKSYSYDETNCLKNYFSYWSKYQLLSKLGIYNIPELDKLWVLVNQGKISIKSLLENKYTSHHIYKSCKKLHADTIFSLWTPLKYFFDISEQEEKNDDTFKKINEKVLTLKKEDKELYDILMEFVAFSSTKGNVMVYPTSSKAPLDFNRKRYVLYKDLILPTLYNCFEGGELSIYFGEKSEFESGYYMDPKEWINEAKLGYFFVDPSNPTKDGLCEIPLKNSKSLNYEIKSWKDISREDMKDIFKYCTNIIKARNNS